MRRALILAVALALAAAGLGPAAALPSPAAMAAAGFTKGMLVKNAAGAPIGVVVRVIQTRDGQAMVLVSAKGQVTPVPAGLLSRQADGTALMSAPSLPAAAPAPGPVRPAVPFPKAPKPFVSPTFPG